GGRGRVLPRRIASVSCRWQEICLPGLASGRLRKPEPYAGAAGGIRGGGARDFSANSGRVGKDGTYAYSPRCREPGCTGRRVANRVETADRDERKDTRQEPPFTGPQHRSKQQTREAMTLGTLFGPDMKADLDALTSALRT